MDLLLGKTYKSLASKTYRFGCVFRFYSRMYLNSQLKGTWSLFIAFAPQNTFQNRQKTNSEKERAGL